MRKAFQNSWETSEFPAILLEGCPLDSWARQSAVERLGRSRSEQIFGFENPDHWGFMIQFDERAVVVQIGG